MGKEMGVREVGLVLCLVLSMSLKPVWVQAQGKAQEAAPEAAQAVALAAAEDAKLEPGPEQPPAQESSELAELAPRLAGRKCAATPHSCSTAYAGYGSPENLQIAPAGSFW